MSQVPIKSPGGPMTFGTIEYLTAGRNRTHTHARARAHTHTHIIILPMIDVAYVYFVYC
eukprot:COSAG03_NODE_8433_length_803_cov_5.451705_2_plen_59_part_00